MIHRTQQWKVSMYNKKSVNIGIWLIIIVFVFGIPSAGAIEKLRSNTLLMLDVNDTPTFLKICNDLKKLGFIAFHKIPPHIVIRYDPGNAAETFRQNDSRVTMV